MAPDPRAPCSRVVGLLADYLEQRLSPPQHRELTRHLDNCQTCVAQLHTYRSTVSLLRSLKEEDLPPDPQRVLGAERELGFPTRRPSGGVTSSVTAHLAAPSSRLARQTPRQKDPGAAAPSKGGRTRLCLDGVWPEG
jgi:anti-sigma factor RsiW